MNITLLQQELKRQIIAFLLTALLAVYTTVDYVTKRWKTK